MNVRRSTQFPAEMQAEQRERQGIDLRTVICTFLPGLSLLIVLHSLVPFLSLPRGYCLSDRTSGNAARGMRWRTAGQQRASQPLRLRGIVDPFSLALVMTLAAQDVGEQVYLLWGFILLAAVIVLVLVELFVPSGGILGAMAGVAGIGSIVAFFMYDTTVGLVALSLYLVLTPIMLWAIYRYWLHSPLAGKMILGGAEDVTRSFEDSLAESERARAERLAQLRQLIGAEGETVTALRPIGTVKIDGQRVDAMAESGTIDPRTRVVVTDVYDNQIKVRPV